MFINCKGQLINLTKPCVMGIINTTPDSFYTLSRTQIVDDALARASQMLNEGATFIDIGGQSTRPGAEPVGEDEELQRVIPIIEAIAKEFPNCFISIDTNRAAVAKAAVGVGASLVNDISGGDDDLQMIETVSKLKVPFIVMHKKGNPQTMKEQAHYNDVALEVFDYLATKLVQLKAQGICDIIIDPGFGFAKTIEHNFELMHKLEVLKQLEAAVLIGISRKSMIWKTLETTPENALHGTTTLNTLALLQGANILRVHDVKPAMDCIAMMGKYVGVD